ncbi:MAG: sodium:calcium antiporter [Sphingomonadaceae bacterium]
MAGRMIDFAALGAQGNLAVFAGAAFVIALLGTRMAHLADAIADRTGLGEALVGAVLLGAGTSISGIVTSVWSASAGYPSLSVANAIGGIAAQTAFLAIADIFYRRVNLEHAAVSAVNLTQSAILILLMALPLLAYAAPPVALWSVHPVTPVLVGVYLVGLRNAHRQKLEPMWRPRITEETHRDLADPGTRFGPDWWLFAQFALLVMLVGLAGYAVGNSGAALSAMLGISQSVVGALMTALVTSLPELVTTVAAVRAGAPQLAIGGIIGGNMFDALFVAASDIAYRDGSIYHAIGVRELFWYAIVIVMTTVLLAGLLQRERRGPAGIGWDSTLLLGLYLAAASVQAALG